ncbi:MAG TPA: hypothetical protein VGZ22_16290, partial [Isosphaeraceae bacterium]|nr:hypothetical protein [Isosphaeraceae bacterium]
MNTIIRSLGGYVVFATLAFGSQAAGQEPSATPTRRSEAIESSSGQRQPGRIIGDAEAGFRFVPEGGGDLVALDPGITIVFDGPAPSPLAALPPFHVLLGTEQRLSGRLETLSETDLRIASEPGHKSISIARGGALALLQRPGETQVLADGFEAIEDAKWVQVGEPEVVADPHLTGARSLRLAPGGTSMTCRLSEPVGSGRFEVAYYDSGARVPGHRWFVDLTFRTATSPQPIRAVLGWEEPSLAVESLQGPTLAVQRLARVPGWHRLVVRFGPSGTELAVDGDELAHGNAPDGPLMEIRLGTYASGNNQAPEGLAAHFDDLTLARLAEPAGDLEIDPSQDELRLVGGDQLYGHVRSANAEQIDVQVAGKEAMLAWTEVS